MRINGSDILVVKAVASLPAKISRHRFPETSREKNGFRIGFRENLLFQIVHQLAIPDRGIPVDDIMLVVVGILQSVHLLDFHAHVLSDHGIGWIDFNARAIQIVTKPFRQNWLHAEAATHIKESPAIPESENQFHRFQESKMRESNVVVMDDVMLIPLFAGSKRNAKDTLKIHEAFKHFRNVFMRKPSRIGGEVRNDSIPLLL